MSHRESIPLHPASSLRISPLPEPWSHRVQLDDGRVLWLRPIAPADAEPIRQVFPLLSPEEVRLRFLHPIKEMSLQMAHRLTHIDPLRQFALVLAEPLPPGEALVGAVARLAIDADTRHAEFAILVSRFLAGRGLGRLLMKRLVVWARQHALDSIYGDVLGENLPMLSLADTLGFRREHLGDEPGLVRVRLDLGSVRAPT